MCLHPAISRVQNAAVRTKAKKKKGRLALTLPVSTRRTWRLALYVFASECYDDLAHGGEAM